MNSTLRSRQYVTLMLFGLTLLIASESEIRMVVFGKTGVGKSSLANTLLHSDYFKTGVGSASITHTSQRQTGTVNTVFGRLTLSIVDTPGLFDTRQNNSKTAEEIGRCVELSLPGPHVFILVTSVTQRFTEEDNNTVKSLYSQFGERISEYMMVVFASKHGLDGMKASEYIAQSTVPLRNILAQCSHRYAFIDTKDHTSQKQNDVDDIMKIVGNIIKKNKGKHYTNRMYEEAVKRKKEEEEEKRRKEKEKEKKLEEYKHLKEQEKKFEEYKQLKKSEQKEQDKQERKALLGFGLKAVVTGVTYWFYGLIPAVATATVSLLV